MSTSRKWAVINVGAGGVFYHGLTQQGVWMYRRACKHALVIDPDTIEAGNRIRQWSGLEDVRKVEAAQESLRRVAGAASVVRGYVGKIEEAVPAVGRWIDDVKPTDVLVVVLPDNHRARWKTHIMLIEPQLRDKARYWVVQGGNDEEDGWAASVVRRGLKTEGDYARRKAELEAGYQEPEVRTGCGALPQAPEQTVEGNVLTAVCVWRVAEALMQGRIVSCQWARELDGATRVWERLYEEVK